MQCGNNRWKTESLKFIPASIRFEKWKPTGMRIHDLLFSASLCSPCLACPCICPNNSHSSLISISLFQHLIFQRHVTTFQICQDQIFRYSVMYSDFQQSKSFRSEERFQNKPAAIFSPLCLIPRWRRRKKNS